MANIGIELKVARIRKRLTQAELAEKTGIGQSTISRIETGQIEGREAAVKILQLYLRV